MIRYEQADRAVGYKSVNRSEAFTLVTNAALTYADTNEHLFTLATSDNSIIEYYKNYGVQIKITYTGNPADVNFIVGALSLPEENATPLTAATLVESGAWDTKTIDLNTSGGTNTETYFIDEITLRGNFLYLKYQYSGDPTNDLSVELKLIEV